MKRQRILIIGADVIELALARRLMNGNEVDITERAKQLHTSGTGIMLGINAMQI